MYLSSRLRMLLIITKREIEKRKKTAMIYKLYNKEAAL